MNYADLLVKCLKEKGYLDWEGTSGGAIELLKDYPVKVGSSGKTRTRQRIPHAHQMAIHLKVHKSFELTNKDGKNWFKFKGGNL